MLTYRLTNGVEIPAIGMGTYPLCGSTLGSAVDQACNAGYRMFDTADNYYNEADLGVSLEHVYANSDVKRADIFLITKLSDELYRPGEAGAGKNKGIYFWRTSPLMQGENALKNIIRKKIEYSLRALKTDYIDALLMHWPYPDYFEEIWHEMEAIYSEGLVRTIGVCNCRERHIERLKHSCSVMPMINQIETSPLNTKEALISYCKENGIQTIVYSPLRAFRELPRHKDLARLLQDLSGKYGKSIGQILLRFDIERQLIPIPKSKSATRISENLDIFDFSLTETDMQQLMACNRDLQFLPESKSCPGI